MRKWAVAYVNSFDNDLTIEIVSADTWSSALLSHSKIGEDMNECIGVDLDSTKTNFFDCDALVDVTEIKDIT